jgi:hypothetical protein
MKEKALRRYIRECILMEKLSDEYLRQKRESDAAFAAKYPELVAKRDLRNLSKDPRALTVTNMINASSGNDLPSLISVFDDLEDYIKSVDLESLKQVTLDVPKKQTKETLNKFKDKLTTFAEKLKQNSRVISKMYEKNNDSQAMESGLSSYRKAGHDLEKLIDSAFKAIMADKG